MNKIMRILMCTIVIFSIFGISACKKKEYIPPKLTVVYDGDIGEATVVNSSSDITIACGPHPLQCADTMACFSKSDETAFKLDFQDKPKSVKVYCWDEKYIDTEENYYDVCTECVMDSEGYVNINVDKGYVYEVVAEYEEYSATVNYCFYIK